MILDDFRSFLIAQNLVSKAWPMYEGYIPDDQDQMQCVFETGGFPPDTMQEEYNRYTVQLRVRGSRLNYAVTRQQWLNCFNTLQGSVLGQPSIYVYVLTMHSGPMTFNDDKGRTNFITNWRVMRKNETSS